MLGDDQRITLHGVYNNRYNAITRPDFKFVVTRYFIDEWVPHLGPALAWLVVGLRQQCFQNRRRNWCIVDKATLSLETALDERTIERCYKKPLSRWFILEITRRYRYRHQIGKRVRDKNRYQLLLDEPLAPRHQLGLSAELKRLASNSSASLEAAQSALQTLLNTPNLTAKISYTEKIPKDLQSQSILELVSDAFSLDLEQYRGEDAAAKLSQQCAELYNQIVQPNKVYVGWQYYRLEWVRLLGHALAWLIISMRRRCYWDPTNEELRDHITIYKKELAAAIGQTPRNLINLMESSHASLFFTDLNPDSPRNKPKEYQVRMVDEPLTPHDQRLIASDMEQQLRGEFNPIDPETGQLGLFPMLPSKRQNFAYGQVSERLSDRERKKCRLDNDLSEKLPEHATEAIGKIAGTLNKDSLKLSDSRKIQKQQIQPVVVPENGLDALLNELSIQEPTRSRLLTNPNITVSKVGAWYLYAETQSGLVDPRGYVIKRLLANDQPPSEFLTFAQLDDPIWSLFEQALQKLRLGQTFSNGIDAELWDVFLSWVRVYGGLDPEEIQQLLARSERLSDEDLAAPASVEQNNASLAPNQDKAGDLWQRILGQLELQMTRETFSTWLKDTTAMLYQDDEIVVEARNVYAKDWLENRLISIIARTVSEEVGKPTSVRFVLDGSV
jgi:hypothetical protein